MKTYKKNLTLWALFIFFLHTPIAFAQQILPMLTCENRSSAPFCKAVRGVRAEGWLAQSRSEVMAQHGIVATSQPLAAQAGLQILMQGGNAIDAAVASAAVLSVVEPMMLGIGSDLFAIIYVAKEKKIYALNASGMAPTGATISRLNSLGYHWDRNNWGPGSGMPISGILTVTVPGTVWGWEEVLKRFGKMTFKEVLEPAIDYAENGFPVSERIANEWRLPKALPLKKCCSKYDPDSIQTWYINGTPPVAGQIFKNPDIAKAFRLLQKNGREAFYKGEIAKAIIAKSDALGGTITMEDLATYKGEWVEPTASTYHGFDIFELPPPSQAWVVNEMLNILEMCVPKWAPGETLASLGPLNPKYWHFLVEAKKLAYNDLLTYNGDPDFVSIPLSRLLAKSYAASLCGKVNPNRASNSGPEGNDKGLGDTVVLTTGDNEGNMVAWVNSNFTSFGSGITIPGYGFALQNRGALFTLDPKSPNMLAPHKRPFTTLSAGFVMREGQPIMTLTLMGGEMQAQGHAQILTNIFDLGANIQAAGDMARFYHTQVPNILNLESTLYNVVGKELAEMGHKVKAINGAEVHGFQSIMFTPLTNFQTDYIKHLNKRVNGFYRAGSDFRKDGQAVGW